MVQLTRSGTVVWGSAKDLERLRAEFQQRHCIRLPQLVQPGLLQLMQNHIERSEFYERVHKHIGVEICMADNNIAGLLHFLTNNPILFGIIEGLTGCERIGSFAGRVYRMVPGKDHFDSWHDDRCEGRLVGMSANLSTEIYSGGVFQLRDSRTEQLLCEMPNTGLGDAILFRIASPLQHRITEVEGAVPKTAFAGWFRSKPKGAPELEGGSGGVIVPLVKAC